MADEPVRLSPRAEELLAAFPVPERDWEADALSIEARLKDVSLGATEARWLEAPLPEEAPSAADSKADSENAVPSEVVAAPVKSEASKPAATPSSPAPKSAPSLADLARSVAAKSSRPQATDIAKESLSVAAAARTHTDAIVERARSSRVAAPPSAAQRAPLRPNTPPPSRRTPPPSRPAEVSENHESARIPARQRSSQALPWVAVGGLGVIAAVLLVERARDHQQSGPVATTIVSEAPTPAQPATTTPSAGLVVQPPVELARGPAVADAESPIAAAQPVAASDAPAARAAAARAPVAGLSGGAAQPGSGAAIPKPAPAAGTPAARPEPEAIVLEDTPARAKAGAAPAHSGLRPAAGAPSGGLPDRPSTGAVQAAIGSVMGGARTCVAGSTTPVPAQVTFGSDGSVTSVSVAGAAAGTPAASCIESALKRARVTPFAAPAFTLMVWVRP